MENLNILKSCIIYVLAPPFNFRNVFTHCNGGSFLFGTFFNKLIQITIKFVIQQLWTYCSIKSINMFNTHTSKIIFVNFIITYRFKWETILKNGNLTCSFSIPERIESYSSSLMSEMNLNLKICSGLLEISWEKYEWK